ncbi:MAG: caspase family protein [Elusimicrobiota bacterium]
MTWRSALSLLAVASLAGCFPTMRAPTVIAVSDLTPRAAPDSDREPIFAVVTDRFRDDRSSRDVLGRYDLAGKGGFLGTETIVSDRDITGVFEEAVKSGLAHKGVVQGPSPFVLSGSIRQINVGSAPDSQALRAEASVQLTVTNTDSGSRLWQKTYIGSGTGADPKATLALAFQDLAGALDRDDSIRALRPAFLAAGGKLPDASAVPSSLLASEKHRTVKSDVDDVPAFNVTPRKNFYAIVIGIERYRQKLPSADFAAHDAQTVTEYLAKLGYPEENVITLINNHAAKSDLEKYLEKWLPSNATAGSSVFIYYSGHGAPNIASGDAYLVPYDGDPAFIDETGYSLNRMYAALDKLPAKQVIVALDSCFSGAGGRSVLAKGARPLVAKINTAAIPKTVTVLAASSSEQISNTYDENGHGLFTYFLLKGIKTKDVVRQDGSLDLPALFAYVKPQVQIFARRKSNGEQTPQLHGAEQGPAPN